VSFQQVTVTGKGPATLIIDGTESGASQQVLLYNPDPVNTVWLSESNSFTAGDVSSCSPLPPLSGISFDAHNDVYAMTIGTAIVIVNKFPGASSFFQPAIVNGSEIINANLLVYNSSGPGLGNLLVAIQSAAGSDSFGNAFSAGETVYGSLVVHGNIVAAQATATTPTVITTDVWHNITPLGTGFTAGSDPPQYALMPDGVNGAGMVALQGSVILNAATPADALIGSIPYNPAKTTQDFVTPNNLSGYTAGQRVVRVAGSGNVRCEPSGANTNFVILDGIKVMLA
jgi:hypothetical protein